MATRTFDYPRFIKTWREYCNNSSLNAVYIIGGFSKISKLNRLFYLFLYFVACAYCTYLWIVSIREYLSYGLKTTIMYNLKPESVFPAITIANINLVRKSAYLSNDPFVLLYASAFYTNSLEELVNRTRSINDKTCINKVSNNTSKSTKQINAKQKKVKTKGSKQNIKKLRDEQPEKDGPQYLFSLVKGVAMDSTLMVKCKWASVDVNCSNIFYNHIIDYRLHFSFNLNPVALLANKSSELQKEEWGFGMNLTDFNLKGVNRAGKRYGLQLVMDDKQQEHCGILKDAYNGAGFQILIHDPATLTYVDIRDGLFLAPGFEYDIELKPQTFDLRETESLGRCRSDVSPWMRHLNLTDYTQHKCYYFCLIDKVFKTCNCSWETMSSRVTEEWTGIKNMTSCLGNPNPFKYFYCAKTIMDALQSNLLKECPHCVRPCVETKYTYNLYVKKLTEQYLTSLLNKSTRFVKNRFDVLKKNHLVANFYFADMTEVIFIEHLKVSSLDLFLNLAGTVGLLMGASVMTFYEILHQIIFSIFDSFKQKKTKLRKRRKQKMHIVVE